MIWEVITENAYPSRLIGFSIGPESLRCLGHKKDGEPGIKCLWKGLRPFFDIAQSWKLPKSSSDKDFKA